MSPTIIPSSSKHEGGAGGVAVTVGQFPLELYLLLAGACLSVLAFVVVFVRCREFRVWALLALVVVLGYLAYLGHQEQVDQLVTDVGQPLMIDIKERSNEAIQSIQGAVSAAADVSRAAARAAHQELQQHHRTWPLHHNPTNPQQQDNEEPSDEWM